MRVTIWTFTTDGVHDHWTPIIHETKDWTRKGLKKAGTTKKKKKRLAKQKKEK